MRLCRVLRTEESSICRTDVALRSLHALQKRRAIGEARTPRQTRELVTRFREPMDRLIVHDAKPMLDATQESIALLEQQGDIMRGDSERARGT